MMELGEGISSLSMWDIVNQSDKYNFSCEAMVNNLKEKKLFLIK